MSGSNPDTRSRLSSGVSLEIPELPFTPPHMDFQSPSSILNRSAQESCFSAGSPLTHQQDVSDILPENESIMTPPRSRPPVRACRKTTIERATSHESQHRISARRIASPKRSRSRQHLTTVSSPPTSRRLHRTRTRAFPTARVTGVATRSVTQASQDVPEDMDDYPDFPETPQEFPTTPPEFPIVPLTYGSANTFATLYEKAGHPSPLIDREHTHLFITFPLSRNLHQLPDVRINVTLGSHDGEMIESRLIRGCEGQEIQIIIPCLLLNT